MNRRPRYKNPIAPKNRFFLSVKQYSDITFFGIYEAYPQTKDGVQTGTGYTLIRIGLTTAKFANEPLSRQSWRSVRSGTATLLERFPEELPAGSVCLNHPAPPRVSYLENRDDAALCAALDAAYIAYQEARAARIAAKENAKP
jgi:hypothetical protein